jgi:hypothetical protein
MSAELEVTVTAQEENAVDLAKLLVKHSEMQSADAPKCRLQAVESPHATLGFDLTGAVLYVFEHLRHLHGMLVALKALLASRAKDKADIRLQIRCGDQFLTVDGKAFAAEDLRHWEEHILRLCKKLARLPK